MGDDARIALFEPSQTDAAVIKLRRKSVAQDAVDPLPGRQHWWTFDSCGDFALVIQDFACGRRDAEVAGVEPEGVQARDQLALRDDAAPRPETRW